MVYPEGGLEVPPCGLTVRIIVKDLRGVLFKNVVFGGSLTSGYIGTIYSLVRPGVGRN
jgi:hypothetical protein